MVLCRRMMYPMVLQDAKSLHHHGVVQCNAAGVRVLVHHKYSLRMTIHQGYDLGVVVSCIDRGALEGDQDEPSVHQDPFLLAVHPQASG